jgi:endoglucanase
MNATDSYATVLAKSNAIITGFKTTLGANAVRIPINETTANTATTWAAYKGIIDAATSQNVKVIIGYWLKPGVNHIPDLTPWYAMWQVVVNAYATNPLVYFDVFNEPSGYSAADFITLVVNWKAQYPSVPPARIIVAGTTTDTDVNVQGADPRLTASLLSLHIYDNGGESAATAEANLKTHVGPYYSRTIVTEYSGATPFLTGLTTQMKAWQMGSCFWAGLEGTSGIAKLSGTSPNYTLTVNNATELALIQSGWSN